MHHSRGPSLSASGHWEHTHQHPSHQGLGWEQHVYTVMEMALEGEISWMFMSRVTWVKFLEARERNGEWAGSQGKSWVSCAADGISRCDISQNALHLVRPREPWSPFFHISQDEFDSICILLLFCSIFILNPAVFAMSISQSRTLHTDCPNDQGWETRASFCSGNKCLILFHQDTWTKNKGYKWMSRWLLKYPLFFFFLSDKEEGNV